MKGIVRACLMFLRFSSFVLIIAIGLWYAADFTSKLVANISNWWISSAVSSLVCSFSLIAVLAIAMATIELSLRAETVESSSPASTTEPASSADNQDGPGTYLIAALCLIAAVILPALAIFPVLNLIHFYPHHWWIALPMLAIAWRLGLSHLNLRRLDHQSSELTSDLRLSNRISSMVSKAGLEKFELRVRHLPALYKNAQKTFAVAKEREPVGLKVAMATQCCAYSCRGRNVVLMCPVTMEELNNKEVDSIIAHEIGHLKLGHFKVQMVLCVLGALIDTALTLLIVMKLSQLSMLSCDRINAVTVLFIYVTMTMFTHALLRFVSREFERRADTYAIETTGDPTAFRSAITKIYEFRKNKKTLQVHVFDTHPPYAQRISLAENMAPKEAA
ncbi:M48 family metalloprotease [bacterium]|nr:M48 family metalloprotease [bacterium]